MQLTITSARELVAAHQLAHQRVGGVEDRVGLVGLDAIGAT